MIIGVLTVADAEPPPLDEDEPFSPLSTIALNTLLSLSSPEPLTLNAFVSEDLVNKRAIAREEY
jgi:hypothetical protein